MTSSRKVIFAVIGIALLCSPALFAQAPRDVPLKNWTVPAFDLQALYNQPGIRPLTHQQSNTPTIFVPFTPCRVFDSRVAAGGPGPIGGVGFGAERPHDVVTNLCGAGTVSDPIQAVSLNVTVLNTFGPGFVYFYPTGGVPPPVVTMNYTGAASEIRNNAAIVTVNAAGSFTIGSGVNGTDYVLDVNGVFLNTLEPNTSFTVVSEVDDAAIVGQNISVLAGAQGMRGHIISTAPGSTAAGVRAQNNSTSGFGYGLWASHAGSASGILATSVTGWGVFATHSAATGTAAAVYGTTNSATDGAAGVDGLANAAGGYTFGVRGETDSTEFDSAGVIGISGYGNPLGASTDCDPCYTAGVRGVDTGTGTFIANASYGVLGLSRTVGVAGMLLDAALGTAGGTAGAVDTDAEGYLGRRSAAATFYGVLSLGGTGATGIKSFVEPHALDAAKVIRYVSLEGPEAGTYFRGKGRFQNGIATIDVPENFRLVTDSEGLSIQVTPIGDMATVAVMSIGLDRIVVRGSRNVEFFYTVNGVRASFKGHQPIGDGNEFIPRKATAKMPRWLSSGQKELLIRNGTYNADGTVNMETAQRLGWDRDWEEAARPQPQPEPLAAQPRHAPGEQPEE